MKKISLLSTLVLTTAMTFPALAQAQTVNFITTMKNYGGRGAYLAIYVTDSSGAYTGTVWLAGGKSKYYRHLSGWARLTGGSTSGINGRTSASVGAGRTLKVSIDLSDALFDAGYTLHVDSAAEDMRESPNDIAVPLTKAGAGTATSGKRYISTFQYDF